MSSSSRHRKARRNRRIFFGALALTLLCLTAAIGYAQTRPTKTTKVAHTTKKVANKPTETVTATNNPQPAATNTTTPTATITPKQTPALVAPTDHTDAGLTNIVNTWAAKQAVSVTVSVQEINGNLRGASYKQTTSIIPASTYKIYAAYAMLHEIEKGNYTLSTKLSDGNTVQTDITNMIVVSDNAAGRAIGFAIGWKNINALLAAQGLTATDLYNYVPPSTAPVGDKHTTAKDLTLILKKLANGSLLNPEHTEFLLGLMKRQTHRTGIPAGVPAGVAVADKPGWLSVSAGEGNDIRNDAGIVYGPKSTYVLVVTTTGTTETRIADLSQQVYAYLQQ